MKITDLSPEMLEKIKALRYDSIIEKHEGPWTWEYDIEDQSVDFLHISGFDVLLPIDREQHPNITPLRVIPSADLQTLTIFLQDTTFSDEWLDSGWLAVCEKMPDTNFFITTVYHEWFIVENELLTKSD